MKKRNRRDIWKVALSFICTKCGYAAISLEQPERCEKCGSDTFDLVKLRLPKDERQAFSDDDRNAHPI